MLADLPSFKTFLRILQTDTSQDALLSQFLRDADEAIKDYCHQKLETFSNIEFRDGKGVADLPLYQKPAWGTGLQVWLDAGGFYGDGVNAFPATNVLNIGKDFVLVRDQPDGSSKSAILRRLGGGITSTTLNWPWQDFRQGTLTARMPPVWPIGYGNIKIQYTSGFGPGAQLTYDDATNSILQGLLPKGTTLPWKLTQCCMKLAAWGRKSTPVGTPVASEKPLNAMIDALNGVRTQGDPEIGSIRQILSRYRDMSI